MNAAKRLASAVPPTKTVFHYTSQEGLLGIVQSKSLWASSVHHLNDSTEYSYPIEHLRAILTKKLRSTRGAENRFCGLIADRFPRLAALGAITFVVSFSEKGDLLSQWRAYTPSGMGFSVGFDFARLRSLAEKQGFETVKCIYEESEHISILESMLKNIRRGFPNNQDAVAAFMWGFSFTAPALKHPSFSEEREWRLVSRMDGYSPARVRFRTGNSMLIPYREIELTGGSRPLPITRILVGPTPNPRLSEFSVDFLCAKSNLKSCEVQLSSVPYRSW